MKTAQFLVEIVIKDSDKLFIVRDSRGQIVNLAKSTDDLASFFDEIISKSEATQTNS